MNYPTGLMISLMLSVALLAGCKDSTPAIPKGKLHIVATLFPVFDMARSIAGDHAEVVLLLPPGVEAHGFEPKPDDLLRINRADLFLYTHRAMEPWSVRLAETLPQSVSVVETGRTATTRPAIADDSNHGSGSHNEEVHSRNIDPHIWLDFDNARRMAEVITSALMMRDPGHADDFRTSGERYQEQLLALDRAYRNTLTNCASRTILQGGHFAFGYLAARYRLDYRAAAAVNPDAEPTPAHLASLIDEMHRLKLSTVFSEEMVPPRLATTIANETGASIRPLNAGHTLSRDDFNRGQTFIGVMQRNLEQLKEGLACR